MFTIALISQKGGAGKTTLALNLAVAAHLPNTETLLVDLDPQASSAAWQDRRAQHAKTSPTVIPIPAPRLAAALETARAHDVRHALIDTAPHSESAALAAARAADLVLIPCRPSIADLDAISTSVELARLAGVPAAAVLNAVPPRGSLPDEAAAAIANYNIPVAATRIGHRIAFVHSMTEGLAASEYQPLGKAAAEIRALWTWINQSHPTTETKTAA